MQTRMAEIRKLLGTPFFETDRCLLYNLNCLDAMAYLPDEMVHLTVTSPPYNIGKVYEQVLALDSYLDWCQSWIMELHRLTRTDGACWLNLGYLEVPGRARALPISYLLWDRLPFYLLQEVVWNYSAGVHTKRMFSPRNEKLLWCVKSAFHYTFNLDMVRDKNVKYPNQRKQGKLKCNPLGKNPGDVWQIPKVTSGMHRSSKERTSHPAQFPLQLVDRIIKASSNECELVLDPFMGSGTTAVAALQHGRVVLGFELSEEYCQIASRRIQTMLEGNASALTQPCQQAEFAL